MKTLDCEQRSDEWFKARIGIPTSSNFSDIITTKGEPSKSAEKYRFKLAGERISQSSEESYSNAAMQRGIDLEPEAIAFYELTHEVKIQKVGFCFEDGKYGCSPDGLVGEDGMIQIKCPSMSVHVSYLLNGTLPTEYFTQIQGELFVTGRKWSDFISYYPGLRPLIVRVERDEKFIKALSVELELFCRNLDAVCEKIKA